MNKELYNTIFKRKSFHTFNNIDEVLNDNDINYIKDILNNKLEPLYKDIKVEYYIVDSKDTTVNRNIDKAILIYSEEKDGYLQNVGYLGEQLDLYLQSNNIASLWVGLGKPLNKYSNLKYVIMICIKKCSDLSKYRKDMYKSKRKELNEVWLNEYYKEIGNIVRFAPSACNSQPWIIEGDKHNIIVNRYTKKGFSGLMNEKYAHYYNSIDIGIFMCFLDLVLEFNNIKYTKELNQKEHINNDKYINAIYKIK